MEDWKRRLTTCITGDVEAENPSGGQNGYQTQDLKNTF